MKYDLDIDHMDAVTIFLQGDMEQEMYMIQVESFRSSNRVCRWKSLHI